MAEGWLKYRAAERQPIAADRLLVIVALPSIRSARERAFRETEPRPDTVLNRSLGFFIACVVRH